MNTLPASSFELHAHQTTPPLSLVAHPTPEEHLTTAIPQGTLRPKTAKALASTGEKGTHNPDL